MFDTGNEDLRNLAWLAFMAEQRGYTDLANAIAGETTDSLDRQEELRDKISRLQEQRQALRRDQDSDAEDDETAA